MTLTATPIAHPLPEGTLVRATRDFTDGTATRRAGFEFEIDDYAPAEETEDGVPFYIGSTPPTGWGNVTAPLDAVEVVRTVEQQNARQVPDMATLRGEVSSGLIRSELGLFEADFEGDDRIVAYGRTPEGLAFEFRVTVHAARRVIE